jgi:hypothetical protein
MSATAVHGPAAGLDCRETITGQLVHKPGRLSPFGVELRLPQTASAGSVGLTSVYGKSPGERQGVRLNGRVARAQWCGAAVDSSEKLDGPQRQRPGSHTVGQSNTDRLPDAIPPCVKQGRRLTRAAAPVPDRLPIGLFRRRWANARLVSRSRPAPVLDGRRIRGVESATSPPADSARAALVAELAVTM